jgi:hypothetical protein
VKNKFWSLNAGAPNLKKLEKGDKVIFYVTEAKRKGFMGKGKLLLFSVKFIDYNNFSDVDAGETVHDWRGCENLRFLLCSCEEVGLFWEDQIH